MDVGGVPSPLDIDMARAVVSCSDSLDRHIEIGVQKSEQIHLRPSHTGKAL